MPMIDEMSDASAHIAHRAAFLAALPPDDLERRLAEVHAASCGPCRLALEEGHEVIADVHAALHFPPPPPEALARAAAAVERQQAAERSIPRQLTLISAGAVVAAWLFQITVGGGFEMDLDCLLVSLGVLAVGVGSVTLLRGRGALALAIIVATSAAFALFEGQTMSLEAGDGIRCTFRELWAAVLTWGIVMTAARRMNATLTRWNVVAVAGASGLAAHAGQHVACKVPHAGTHLFVFHFGGVVMSILLSALASMRLRPVPAHL
jgi:hypothetical protein